jgi:flagellar motor switch protein FliM
MVARYGSLPLELRAVLGRAEFALDELTSLRVGDVIALDSRSPDPIEIFLGDRFFCRARAGLAGQHVALEILAEPQEETQT